MKKIILITWWLWYIWSHAVVSFEQSWYKTVIVDNLWNSDISTLEWIKSILWYKPDFFEIDIRDKQKLEEIFKKYNFDWVIHFAWLKSVWESCENPLKYFDNNIIWSIRLFECMEKFLVKNIIFSSSATVYDYDNPIPYIENQNTWKTTNPYWNTKFIIEKILYDLSKFLWLNVISLRYFNPIWAHPSWFIWEEPNWIPNNLLPFIMKVATWELEKLKIFWDDYDTIDWTWVRDYIDISDLINWHLKAYENIFKWFNIYNLWVGKWVSVFEMLNIWKKITWKDIKYEIVDRRYWDIWEFYCDSSKAKKELNWEPKIDIKESFKNSWNFYNRK